MKVLLVFGTRPEAIKLAPVIRALAARAPALRTVICVTAQHRAMLDQILRLFRIVPDHDLDLMRSDQDHLEVLEEALRGVRQVMDRERPDLVLVQGDTTTALAAALAAGYRRVPVAHVEAGLRTHDPAQPFPEEINRRLTAALAALHFAPTEAARANLRAEGVPDSAIFVTGNTGIDALLMTVDRGYRFRDGVLAGLDFAKTKVILVTAHRRESFGPPLAQICRAIRALVETRPEVAVVFPVHPNPHVQPIVHGELGALERVHLVPPLDYEAFVQVLDRAHLVLTDSGGIQEEAPCLGKPVVVLRRLTERPEALAAGSAVLAGTDPGDILRETSRLLDDPAAYADRAVPRTPFGDGQAAGRIAEVIASWADRQRRTDAPGA